jgi:LacI family transcriptional regulator
MNMYWKVSLALALIIGIFYSFPPYTVQATYYYLTHSSELNTMDIAFTESDDTTWEYKNRKLAPIFKTKDGSRLYFMGSLKRFKKQYDIAFIKGHPDHSSTTLRFSGYLKALEKNNIEFKPELVDEGNFSYHSGEDSARKILNLKVRPSAVFASNDYMAAAVLKVASQLTLKVPEQLSIAGFDNAPIARHIWPGLTTIAQPVEKMTYIAINKLIEQFTSQEEALPIHKETLEAQLINRESTGRFSE